MVSIVNYGLGNLGSIQNMLRIIGVESIVVTEPKQLANASKIILPGVGAFDTGMSNLIDGDWLDILNEKVIVKKTPVLGICLGMQLLCRSSEEGKSKGLGLIEADVVKFRFSSLENLKIPHMGWNVVTAGISNRLIPDLDEVQRYYFVHTYKVVPDSEDIIIGRSNYGGEFCAAFQQGNVYGVQFHPEKSHRFGIELFKRFISL